MTLEINNSTDVDTKFMNEKVEYHYQILNEGEVCIIICLTDSLKNLYGEDLDPIRRGDEYWTITGSNEVRYDFGTGSRVIELLNHKGKEYIIIGCKKLCSILICDEFRYKGECNFLYSINCELCKAQT